MKEAALPPLPTDRAPASTPMPRPRRPEDRAPPADTHIPPPPPKSGPSRLPAHAASMPPARRSSQPAGSGSPSTHNGNNIFRRFTSKLRVSSAPSPGPAPQPISGPTKPPPAQSHDAAPQRRRTGLRMPSLPKAPVPAAPPNDFTSLEQRQAALRARGLLPPAPGSYRDAHGFMVPLSEQEAELDRRFTVVVEERREEEEQESEARKIREAWLARNKDVLEAGRDDAVSRASRDGTLGDKSPVLATYVDAPILESGSTAEIASPLEATVEDFQTAPNTPAKTTSDATTTNTTPTRGRTPRDPPGSPSSNSSVATEKVSRWLRSSTDAPTPLSVSTDQSAVQTPLCESPSTSLANEAGAQIPQAASPAGTVKAAKPRKEKPPPIVVTTQRPSKDSDVKAPTQIISVAVAAAALSDSEASTSDGRSSLEARGRHHLSTTPPNAKSQPHPPLLAQANSSSTSGGSRSTTLPALSPTRTISSSGAESTLPTPTTTSCQRDVSISRGSTSHSSDQSHGITGRSRRGTGPGLVSGEDAQAKAGASGKRRMSGAGAGGLIQSSIEETDSSEEGEFGAGVPAQNAPVVPAARARPPRAQTAEQAAEAQANRKSFSLFGKKSLDSQTTRPSSSMSNLRRAFSGGLASKLNPRPRSSIDPSTSTPEMSMGRKPSKMFDASHLPSSPTHPPTSFPGVSAAAVPLQGRTTGVGLRPRQAVSPTMHNRGSILHQTHFIEDDESRRLSEMAFLT
ncbi:hypothetical protein OH77DRAFT_906426 [Trametes cingulata]|nr:hypothetical protein OH77DRAFT_906426 [Trametes cingulata]